MRFHLFLVFAMYVFLPTSFTHFVHISMSTHGATPSIFDFLSVLDAIDEHILP